MKVLVVSQYFYPEVFRVNTLCRELTERGHRVTVLTAYPQYPIGRIYDGYGFDLPYEKDWHGVRIERVKTYPRGKNPLTLLRNCTSFVRSAEKWVKQCEEKFDVCYIFGVSPASLGLPAIAYRRKFGTPVLYHLQDLWPDNVHEVLGLRFPPLTWAINKMVGRLYRESDRILCTSNGFVEHLAELGVDRKKLVFWPQFCLDPDTEGTEKPEIYSDDTFNIVFTGNIGDAQGLDLVVEAAKELKGCGIRWYLVGDGRAKERLKALAKETGVGEDVVFVDRVSEAEANRYVRWADCAYLSFQNNPLFRMMLPAKLQTYLACGAPILGAVEGESADVIRNGGCGIAAKPEKDALVQAAKQMAALSHEERSAMSRASRQYFLEHFTMDMLLDRLEDLMNEVVREQSTDGGTV